MNPRLAFASLSVVRIRAKLNAMFYEKLHVGSQNSILYPVDLNQMKFKWEFQKNTKLSVLWIFVFRILYLRDSIFSLSCLFRSLFCTPTFSISPH